MILVDFLFCLNSDIILKEWESKQKQPSPPKKELEKQFKRITALSTFAHENDNICLNRDYEIPKSSKTTLSFREQRDKTLSLVVSLT